MAEVKKARLFLRRGTDTDRIATTLCEGELGYSTDAFRVIVGDGTTAGGRSLGTTVFVSAGSLARHFHTKLTTASAGGLAHTGDLAVFPALAYFKADGATASSPSASATTVMLLTGSTPNDTTSWVSINSGIPWGNLHVQADDITGDYISGGNISGDVTFSGTINTTKITTTSAIVSDLAGTGHRNVFVTSTGQLTAEDNVGDGKTADGTLQFLSSPLSLSKTDAASAGPTSTPYWFTCTNPAGIPRNATVGLFQFVWPGHATNAGAGEHHVLEVRKGSGTTTLSAAYERASVTTGETAGGAVQFNCPLSSDNTNVKFQYRLRLATEAIPSTTVFDNGHNLSMLGYM